MILKFSQTVTQGFSPWKNMVHNNPDKLREHGITVIFAGTEQEDDTKMTAILNFASTAGLEAFKADAEIAKARVDAGVDLESTVITPMSDESFSNYPG